MVDRHADAESASAAEDETAFRQQRWVCIACDTFIVSAEALTDICKKPYHTFANPAGEVFSIGCFTTWHNLAAVGSVTKAFTWFPGYGWQVMVCEGCGLHLGWAYSDMANDRFVNRFVGLIMNRLNHVSD